MKHFEVAVHFLSCQSAICCPICTKFSDFVYFDMGIAVQSFVTSFRPQNGQLASLQPHSGLRGHNSTMIIVQLLILEHPMKRNSGFLMFSSLKWRLFNIPRLPVFGLLTSSEDKKSKVEVPLKLKVKGTSFNYSLSSDDSFTIYGKIVCNYPKGFWNRISTFSKKHEFQPYQWADYIVLWAV